MAVKLGVREWYYAKLLTDNDTGTTYSPPKRVVGLMEVSVGATTSSDPLYTDDMLDEVLFSISDIKVKIVDKRIPLEVTAELLGHTYKDGHMVANVDDVAPCVAIGYRSTYNDGKSRYAWLYKGQFGEMADENKTRGKTPTAQPETIEGTFMPRLSDGNWKHVGDEHDKDFKDGDKWFEKVQEPPAIGDAA